GFRGRLSGPRPHGKVALHGRLVAAAQSVKCGALYAALHEEDPLLLGGADDPATAWDLDCARGIRMLDRVLLPGEGAAAGRRSRPSSATAGRGGRRRARGAPGG